MLKGKAKRKPYDGDILETALNSGISFSSKKHGVSVNYVLKIVKMFKDELDDYILCSCEKARLEGSVVMCFMCDKPKPRINI